MIRNCWYPIYDAERLKRRHLAGITRLGERLVLWRGAEGNIICLPDRCSHRAAPLSRGRIVAGCVQCSYHGLRFDEAGRCVMIPANGRDAKVPNGFDLTPRTVREAHGLVWYWYGDEAHAEAEVPWLENAEGAKPGSYLRELDVPVSWLRVMENLLDFHHLPFVHRWTVPDVGSRFDDFEGGVEGDVITIKGTLRKQDDVARKTRGFPIEARVRFPCIAAFDVFPGVHFIGGATPIDENRCWLWARYGQDYLPRALFGRLLMRIASFFDFTLVFRMGDQPMLMSQLDPAGDISRYRLYEADKGIGLYFAMYREQMQIRGAARTPPPG
jgi:nitrite reductase/ring-hydroxylating ferredoxin subunit